MQDRAPFWVDPVMRVGYAARGIVYLVIGGLAVAAAWSGGQAEGTKGALAQLRGTDWGPWVLWAVAAGLLAYGVWRLICAGQDLENFGRGAKAAIARTGQTISGLIHLGLAVTAGRMAMGAGQEAGQSAGQNGDGSGPKTLASWLLGLEWGQYIVMGAGLVVVAAGLFYGYKAFAEKYKAHIRATATTERLDPVIKAGLIAHGVVIALIGAFLFYAGQTSDPGQAGGIGQAFQTVRSQPYGQILLTLLGIGTVAFAIYCWVEAIWRVIPRRAGPDVKTLATRARIAAEAHTPT